MASLTTLSKEDLEDLHSSLWNTYKQEQTKDLHLNMSRGKPSAEQLDLSMELLQFPKSYTLAALTQEIMVSCRELGSAAVSSAIFLIFPQTRSLWAETQA